MATSSDPQNHSHHLVLLTLIAIMISVFSMLGISYVRFLNSVKNKAPQNYEDCIKLKDSIISLTYPQTCTTKDGKNFVQAIPSNSPTIINENRIYCQNPRPEMCTLECLANPPYLCGSNGKSYCTTCQACADSEVDWYLTQDSPCSSPTATPVPETQPYDCCGQTELNQGYECLQGCGAPVARENDPTPPFSCLNPTEAYSRKTFGCPICLASNTFISTPKGAIKVTDLKVGMLVWSVNKEGNKIAVPIVKLSKTRVPQNHHVNHLVLSDGRSLDVSPNHPDVSGKPISLLQPGDIYDKSVVFENSLLPYWDLFTYDLLPDSETGFYFANGILLKSTLKK